MPTALTYPGVYMEEVASGVRTITGVPTSIAAFIGRAQRGPVNKAITINGYGDFERVFGGLWLQSQLGFAVRDFFLNGGGQAIIVRLFGASDELSDTDRDTAKRAANAVVGATVNATDGDAAKIAATTKAATYTTEPAMAAATAVALAANSLPVGATKDQVVAVAQSVADTTAPAAKAALLVGDLEFVAASEGRWGANLRCVVDMDGTSEETARGMGLAKDDLFNLTVRDAAAGGANERYANLTVKESSRRVDRVLAAESSLLRWQGILNPSASADAKRLDGLVAELKALAEAERLLKAAAATDIAAAKLAVATALAKVQRLSMDPVSLAERALAEAKAALTVAQVSGVATKIDSAKLAFGLAQLATEAARRRALDAVSEGRHLKALDFSPAGGMAEKRGLYALEQADLFNLLCIPPYKPDGEHFDVDPIIVAAATAYCESRRAIHLIDPPSAWKTKDDAKANIATFPETRSKNAALYFPRLRQANLLRENRIETFAPCGAVAGVIARTDTQRGVWKAPAGLDATFAGVSEFAANLTDAENGELNPLGINCLRAFPAAGRVVWGSRTLRGHDQLADEWKYLPVRRTALFIEESLYRGTQWVVFEPNDETLWSQIRLNVGAFMHGLFRQGAFQGQSPRDAYFVKCDKETTLQADIDLGVVNIKVGFKPLKPAEFVVIRIQQIAGQIQT